MRLTAAILFASVAFPQQRTYQDPEDRFQFDYPASFGRAVRGADDGFRDRVAVIRFSEFSSGFRDKRIVLGGEAVLTSGLPLLELQAAGGLYNALTLQIFPENVSTVVRSAAPVLSAASFCEIVGRERHIHSTDLGLRSLTDQQINAVLQVDPIGNLEPAVERCRVDGDTVTFDKKSMTVPGGPRRHIHGAVRFLASPYSTFQLIRGTGDAPAPDVLDQITALVKSWRPAK